MEPLIFQRLRTEAPNPRQQEFFRCEARYVAYGGARGGMWTPKSPWARTA